MHRSLLKPFVYLASVCWSLQCLNFHPDRRVEVVSCSGSLVQSYCEEGGALQTNVIGLCGEHSHCFGGTGLPLLTGVCFPHLHCSGSRLLYMEWALHCVRFQFSGIPQKRRLGWACLVGAAQAARSLTDALTSGATRIIPLRSQPQFPRVGRVRPVSVLGSWPLGAALLADVDHPEFQEVFG